MSSYVVKFFKKLVSDDGHEVDACQFTVDTIAPRKRAASKQD